MESICGDLERKRTIKTSRATETLLRTDPSGAVVTLHAEPDHADQSLNHFDRAGVISPEAFNHQNQPIVQSILPICDLIGPQVDKPCISLAPSQTQY